MSHPPDLSIIAGKIFIFMIIGAIIAFGKWLDKRWRGKDKDKE